MTRRLTRAVVGTVVGGVLGVAMAAGGSGAAGAVVEDAGLAAPRMGPWGFDVAGMDRAVRPGDDFGAFAWGAWARTAQIPGDRSRWGAFDALRELSERRVRAILEGTRTEEGGGGDRGKLAALFASYMDEATVERRGVAPLGPMLEEIRSAGDKGAIAGLMGRGRFGFGASLFGVSVGEDAKKPGEYTVYVRQSGLGLPDREFYLQERFRPQRDRYRQYVAVLLEKGGWASKDAAEVLAEKVVALETQMARAHWTRADSRDRDKTYNPMTVAELEALPGTTPWRRMLDAAGMEKVDRVIVSQVSAVSQLGEIFAAAELDTLRAWMAAQVIDDAAPLLNREMSDLHFEFRQKFLQGVPEQRERAKRAVSFVEGAMGEAVGREYVALYFPTSSKRQMEQLVAHLRVAMGHRIENLTWMSPETKSAAQDKLTKFGVKIGYPEKWRDYSALEVKPDDLFGNALRARRFAWEERLGKLGTKVDPRDWGMTPQTVNAYYSSTRNEIVFPAAILQPPFFDPEADPAVNYGAIGGVIGHEITHGFDDQGRKSDGDGVLRDWWTRDDAIRFEAEARKLGAQYEAYEFERLPGLRLTGRLTMGENIADLGGVLLALDGYRLHLTRSGAPAPVLDGFTGEQRVFLGWAQVWRTMMRDDALRQQIVNGPHSPGQIRAFAPLRNVDAWYEAFGVKEGDRQWVAPVERVRVW